MQNIRAYGHHRTESWVQCRAVVYMTLVLFVLALAFFSFLGALYIPFWDAKEARIEARRHAETYLASDVCTPRILAQLGRHGEADCAMHKKTLELDIDSAASKDVLMRYNLCKDGECIFLSFNLVTFMTQFMPLALGVLVLLFGIFGCCMIKWALSAMRGNAELPYTVAAAIVEQQMQQKAALADYIGALPPEYRTRVERLKTE